MAATTPVRIRDSAFTISIYGLVGYDDRLTRGRSPVRFRVDVLFRYLRLVFALEKNMTGVGFEPTPPKRLVPKTSALDHSANQSLVFDTKFVFYKLNN